MSRLIVMIFVRLGSFNRKNPCSAHIRGTECRRASHVLFLGVLWVT
jgi:hypothetical protein